MSLSSSRTSAWKPRVSFCGVVMAPAGCGRALLNSRGISERDCRTGIRPGAEVSALAHGAPDRQRRVLEHVTTRANEVVDFIPEQQEAFHGGDRRNTDAAWLCRESQSNAGWLPGPRGIASLSSASHQNHILTNIIEGICNASSY